MCDHGDDKDCTYLKVFDSIGEVYMCECGALTDVNNTYIGYDKYRAMTPEELTELVQELVNEKVKAIKAKVLEAIEGA